MNFYFVVEGETEKQLYSKWIKYIFPSISQIQYHFNIIRNHFFIISGGGYPDYLTTIKNAFKDVQDPGNRVDYLFICVDSEDLDYQEKLNEMNDFISVECPHINCEKVVVIHNHCIENWLMGNKNIDISRTRNQTLLKYRTHYNVNVCDPEGLTPINSMSIGRFSKEYLRLMLREHDIKYYEGYATEVNDEDYFNQLIIRFENDNHIKSFGIFLNKIRDIKNGGRRRGRTRRRR